MPTLGLRVANAAVPASGALHSPNASGLTEMCSGSEAGSYLRLIDFCITFENNKEEEEEGVRPVVGKGVARDCAAVPRRARI